MQPSISRLGNTNTEKWRMEWEKNSYPNNIQGKNQGLHLVRKLGETWDLKVKLLGDSDTLHHLCVPSLLAAHHRPVLYEHQKMSLVQLSCLVPTASSGNPNTSGLFNVFMVLWVLSYMSKVPGAQQCTTHNRNHCSLRCGGSCRRALQQQLVPSAVTLSSVSPTSAGVTTTKVSLLSPLGTL